MINIPINAVLAIYAKENSQGMMFTGEETLAENNAEVEQKDSRKIRYLELLNRVLTRLRASLVYILKEFHNSVHHPIAVPLLWQYQIQLGSQGPLNKQRLFR